MAIDITLDLLKAAVIKLAELTGENRFVLIGRATLAITAPAPFQEFARSDDIEPKAASSLPSGHKSNRQKDRDFLRAGLVSIKIQHPQSSVLSVSPWLKPTENS